MGMLKVRTMAVERLDTKKERSDAQMITCMT